jgi:hypothetical protein
MNLLLSIVTWASVAALTAGSAWILARRATYGAAMVLLLFVTDAAIVQLPGVELGLWIYPQDVLSILLALVGVLRFLNCGRLGAQRLAVVALVLMFLTSLGRGFVTFGAKLAGNECRSDTYFLAGLLYFASFTYDQKTVAKIVRQWMLAASALVLVALFRWTATLLGLSIVSMWSDIVVGFPFRVLNSRDAFFLLTAALLSFHIRVSGQGTRWQRCMVYAALPIAILLQHRTVWICACVAVFLLACRPGRIRKRLFAIAPAVVLAGVLVAPLLVSSRDPWVETYKDAAYNSGTLEWRIEGWQQVVSNHLSAGPVALIIGQPYGTGFLRFIDRLAEDSSPHNNYVQLSLRTGLIGLFCLLALYLTSLRRITQLSSRLQVPLYPDASFWRILLIINLVYFLTYSPAPDQALLMGVLVGLLRPANRKMAFVLRSGSPTSSFVSADRKFVALRNDLVLPRAR